MKTSLLKTLAMAALGCTTLTVAHAHRAWILASTTVLSGEDQWISVDAAISNDLFFPNHFPMQLASLTVLAPGGGKSELQNSSQGKIRSTFDLHLDRPGTYKIVSARSGLMASYKENGESKRFRGSKEEFLKGGYKSKEGLQVTESSSRVETIVTSGAPTTDVLKPTGEGLELQVKGTHPNDIFTDEDVTLGLLLNGQPAAGVEVTVVKGDDRFRKQVDERKFKTDAAGLFTLKLTEAGRYWLNASTRQEGGTWEGLPVRKSASYVLTFEVLPQ